MVRFHKATMSIILIITGQIIFLLTWLLYPLVTTHISIDRLIRSRGISEKTGLPTCSFTVRLDGNTRQVV